MKTLKTDIATIEKLSHDGRGIARINDKATFVAGALPAEKVLLQYDRMFSKYNEAHAIEINNPSELRVTPPCSYFGMCGGCSLQHIKPSAQIIHKQTVLLEQLQHFGNVVPQEVLPPITGPVINYRHKARLAVKFVAKKDKVLVGFHEINGRYIADIDSCVILPPNLCNKISALKNLIYKFTIKHAIAQIEVAIDEKKIALIIRHLHPFTPDDKNLLLDFAEENNFTIYLQAKGPETITKIFPIDNCEFLSYKLPNYNIEMLFLPSDFTQVNPDINAKMVALAINLLEPNKEDDILDLFCGIGNFTLPIAKFCRSITGIEGADLMVQRAYKNALHNNIVNANFYTADLTQDLTSAPWFGKKYQKVLLDPPRSGALSIINQFNRLQYQPEKILYISCNPATLARDSNELVNKQNYILTKTGVLDMFPHTSHVESYALFTRA